MTEWKTIPIKLTVEEEEIIQRIAKYYGFSRNKLIRNILGNYLQGELQISVFSQLQLEQMIPKEFFDEYNTITKNILK